MLPILLYGFEFIGDITIICMYINEVYVSWSQISLWLYIHPVDCIPAIWYVIPKPYLEIIAKQAIWVSKGTWDEMPSCIFNNKYGLLYLKELSILMEFAHNPIIIRSWIAKEASVWETNE